MTSTTNTKKASGAASAATDKEKRIQAERERLDSLFSGIAEDFKQATAGLIERAAFMRISLEDLEKELNLQGFAQMFKQGEKQEAYPRENPAGKSYISLISNYQKIIKQLTDLLPTKPAPDVEDEFERF